MDEKVINAKPFDLPVYLSMMILISSIEPNSENASLSSVSVVHDDKEPTYILFCFVITPYDYWSEERL